MRKRTTYSIGLTVAVTAALVASFTTVTHADPASGVSATVLNRATFDGFNVRSDPQGPIADFRAHSTQPIDLVIRQHDYQVGSTTGWHAHPGPVFITVKTGSLTYFEYDDPCTPHVVTAGHGFVDTGSGHMVRNLSGTPAQDISVIVAPVGAPFRTELVPPSTTCSS